MWIPSLATTYTTITIHRVDTDNNLFMWSQSGYAGYYITDYDSIGIPIVLDGSSLGYPMKYMIQNKLAYKITSVKYVWYDIESTTWIISKGIGYDIGEWEEIDFNGNPTGTWFGGQYHQKPTGSDVDGTYEGRGADRGDPNIVVTIGVVQDGWWYSPDFYGEYNEIGAGTTKKYIGWEKLTFKADSGPDLFAYQNNEKLNGDYIFTSPDITQLLWYDNVSAKWIFSNAKDIKDATIGYWESSGSNKIDTYTLVYSGDPPNPTPTEYEIISSERIAGLEQYHKIDSYLTQTALWNI